MIMKAKLFLSVFFLFLVYEGFGKDRSASLQIDFFQNNYSNYVFELGNQSFRVNGTLNLENLQSGFYPVAIYELQGRNKRVVYSGGINLASEATTFAFYKNRKFQVAEVIPYYVETIPIVETMNSQDFFRFKQSVSDEWFDSSRLELMEMNLQFHHFTSYQISQLMDELSFDSSKLQFAKAAFSQVVDPENYYMVREKLDFSSSKTELTRYINQVVAY